eukprot:SAG31_NODE_26515_length_441_cov_0.602339_1_plen_52_part_10
MTGPGPQQKKWKRKVVAYLRSTPIRGLTGLELPTICTAACAQEYLSFHADCK